MLPAAVFSLPGGAGVMACRDGSLVSLFRLDGARSTSAASPPSTFATSSRRLSRLRSRFTWFGANTVGRVQAAITKLSAAISGARRQPRSAITSPSVSTSRSHCCSVCSPAAATSRAASSGARSNTACSAWPGPEKTLLRRRAPSSMKPSSSRKPGSGFGQKRGCYMLMLCPLDLL